MLRKKMPFKILRHVDNAPGHPRALMDINKIYDVFMLTNLTSVLQPMTHKVILTFKSYYLTNTFLKNIQLPQTVIPLLDLGKEN